MKTILADALGALVMKDTGIVPELHTLLESYPNPKIILTNANDAEMAEFLPNMPYEVFTLKHNPEKTDPRYYTTMLAHYKLTPDTVVYFEHNLEAVRSARSVGIETHLYTANSDGHIALTRFLRDSLAR